MDIKLASRSWSNESKGASCYASLCLHGVVLAHFPDREGMYLILDKLDMRHLAEAAEVLQTEQVYTDPSRANDPHHLPDGIVFQTPDGWFWQSQMPGCLPDSDPIGPFDTRQAAIEDCQDIG